MTNLPMKKLSKQLFVVNCNPIPLENSAPGGTLLTKNQKHLPYIQLEKALLQGETNYIQELQERRRKSAPYLKPTLKIT